MFFSKSSKVANGYEEHYAEHARARHLQLFFPLTFSIFIIEVLLLFVQFLRLGSNLFSWLYFYVYIVAIVVCGTFSLIYQGYRTGRLQHQQTLIDKLFICSMFGLAVFTALAEIQATQTQSPIFIVFSFFVAALCCFSIKFTYFVLLAGNFILICFILLFINNWDISLGLIFNYLFLLVASSFVVRPLRNSSVQKFNQSVELERANLTLKRTNLRLELMNKQLEETSVTDALTGIFNRLAFNKSLELSWEQALLVNDYIAVIMLDTDNFKQYNDHFGHLEGDRCLKTIASTIQNCLMRPSDHVFRYGGEEFVVLLPGNSAKGAETVANRILQEIEQLAIAQYLPGKVVTISAGIHGMTPTEGDNMFDLVDKADKALYYAKKNGRNQVAVYNKLPQDAKNVTTGTYKL